jgi:hypothetical protein
MRENRIALYGRRGETLWEKGGVFGKWKLLELTASGRLLLCDDSSFYVLGRTGKIELKHKLPGSVRTFLRGPQRDKVAVYFSDGQLCVFSVE